MSKLGCEHYQRNCTLKCPTCDDIFTCRHCHNEKWELHQDLKKQHLLHRGAVETIICLNCNKEQGISNECVECKIKFGKYYCEKCRFWDNDVSKDMFHCDDCGICRMGKKEEYFHCHNCNGCFHKESKVEHDKICRGGLLKSNCPICIENLSDTCKQVVILICSHAIHEECLNEFASKNKPVCPLCNKFYIPNDSPSIKSWIELMDLTILETPIPEEHQKEVSIKCYECEKYSNVQWHPVGHKCQHCQNYNTVIL